MDARTARHAGYTVRMKVRKRVEEPFSWGKTAGLIWQVKVRGLKRVDAIWKLTAIEWNLTRMRNLQGGCETDGCIGGAKRRRAPLERGRTAQLHEKTSDNERQKVIFELIRSLFQQLFRRPVPDLVNITEGR